MESHHPRSLWQIQTTVVVLDRFCSRLEKLNKQESSSGNIKSFLCSDWIIPGFESCSSIRAVQLIKFQSGFQFGSKQQQKGSGWEKKSNLVFNKTLKLKPSAVSVCRVTSWSNKTSMIHSSYQSRWEPEQISGDWLGGEHYRTESEQSNINQYLKGPDQLLVGL